MLIRYRTPRKILKKLVDTTVTLRCHRLRVKGLIEKLSRTRITPGLILVPARNEQTLQQALQQLGAKQQVVATILAPKHSRNNTIASIQKTMRQSRGRSERRGSSYPLRVTRV